MTFYGLNKIRYVIKIRNLKNIDIESDLKILVSLFLITYANPHVYLDTIILIGSISTILSSQLFLHRCSMASFIFFFALGYLSKPLSKYIFK